jgi:hypothetical protein
MSSKEVAAGGNRFPVPQYADAARRGFLAGSEHSFPVVHLRNKPLDPVPIA